MVPRVGFLPVTGQCVFGDGIVPELGLVVPPVADDLNDVAACPVVAGVG
jgi:hypothetical protein